MQDSLNSVNRANDFAGKNYSESLDEVTLQYSVNLKFLLNIQKFIIEFPLQLKQDV